MATIGENIRRLRRRNGMRQIELAKHAGLSQGQLSNYETGKEVPKVPNLIPVADALHCRLDELDERLAMTQAWAAETMAEYTVPSMRRVPIYGLAMAKGVADWHGDVIPDGEYQLATIEIPDDGRRYAAFKIEGDSMEPEIRDGDIVLADLGIEPESGNIVVAKWDDTVMCKRFRRYGRQIVLESVNPRYDPVQVRPIWMLRVKRVMREV